MSDQQQPACLWAHGPAGDDLMPSGLCRICAADEDEGPCPRCGGDHEWCQTVRDDEYAR